MGTTSSYTNSGGTKADDELLGVRAGNTVNLWPLAAVPAAATDSGTDAYTVALGRDIASGESVRLDFGSANTTTAPSLENTGGAPAGAVTIKARDGSALWAGALSGVHTLQYDGTDFLVVDPAQIGRQPVDPEGAIDSGTDAYVSDRTTAKPGSGKVFLRDFGSANTTASPTLDTVSLVDVAGNAWAGMIEARVHRLYDDGTNYVVLDPGDTYPRKIASGALASGASEIVLSLPTGYRSFEIDIAGFLPASDDVALQVELSTDGGSTWATGYDMDTIYAGNGTTAADASSASSSHISLMTGSTANQGNASGEECSGRIYIDGPENASIQTSVRSHLSYRDTGGAIFQAITSAKRNAAEGHNALRLTYVAGNITAGAAYTLWGHA